MAFGVLACFSTTFWLAVSSFWVFNMLGAALLPGAFGLMLAAVRPERTSAASAIAQIPINLLGMAGGAYIPGWLTGCNQEELPDVPFCDADCDYALGLRSLLLGPIFGFLALMLALCLYSSDGEEVVEQSENQELSIQTPKRRTTGVNTLVLGIIDQLDGKAGTMVLRMDEEISLPKLLARAAECTGNPTRRLFSEDGQEILGLKDVQSIYDRSLQEGGQKKAKVSSENPGLSIDLELVSTDGSNFKWKWGSNHAHYRFGDLLIRPLWRSLAGSRAARAVVHPPQPIPLPTSGNLKDCLPDLWIQCFPLCERYGPLIKLRIFDDVVYVVADPEIVDIVNQIPDKRLPREVARTNDESR
ncbi:cypD [Symbiodinium pilosum]|uniref:CypD protein n=1 Tax=Symbiodinium pilosum TaxID=2952 RepID=A0A812LR24_SYMPI|nr:cypD [Symbiodinium pilosum]